MSTLSVRRYVGREIEPLVPALADLRTEVFREYPYLYDGGIDKEIEYLQTYLDTAESLCVAVFDGDEVVGASTGLPLSDADEAFRRPFVESDIAPHAVFYFGESVLAKRYRGRGLGHRFFDERERFARELGRFQFTAFCAVDRSFHHPLRPPDYRPLDPFWRKRGYERRADLQTTFAWKEVSEDEPSEKRMVFWIRPLGVTS